MCALTSVESQVRSVIILCACGLATGGSYNNSLPFAYEETEAVVFQMYQEFCTAHQAAQKSSCWHFLCTCLPWQQLVTKHLHTASHEISLWQLILRELVPANS